MRHVAGRRTFIRTVGAVSLGGLAGCIDGGDTVANENPTGEQSDDTEDANSGDQLWDRKLGGAVEMSPAVDAEGVIVAAGKTLYKLRRVSGDVMWETELEEASESSPVVTEEAIYFGDNGGRILAHDTDDGTKRWEHETDRSVRAPPAMADDALVVGNNHGRLYSLR